MSKAKRIAEEKQSLLLDDEAAFEVSHRDSRSMYEITIAKGVADRMAKWPSHVFAAFLAATLVFAAFVLFAIVAALFCAPKTTHIRRKLENVELKESPNIYFVKHANRTWSTRELCYVESTVRKNPQIKVVYIINLLPASENENTSHVINAKRFEKTNERDIIDMLWKKSIDSMKNSIDSSKKITLEADTRNKLGAHYSNVRNLDVDIDDFFEGSMLSHICDKLDEQTVTIAAKAYVLWNNPGVALDPEDSRYLRHLQSYICTHECSTSVEAAMNVEASIQASGVACQAFVGCLIHRIAIQGSFEHWKIVKKCQQSFCRRLHDCPGLKILNEESRFNDEKISCPTTSSLDIESTKKYK